MEIHSPEMHATGFRALLEIGAEQLGRARMDEILATLGVARHELEDPTAWFSLRLAEALIETLERETNDAEFLVKMAKSILSPKNLGPLYPFVRAFGTPGSTYTQMVSIARRVNKVGQCDVQRVRPGQVRLRYRTV